MTELHKRINYSGVLLLFLISDSRSASISYTYKHTQYEGTNIHLEISKIVAFTINYWPGFQDVWYLLINWGIRVSDH